MPYRSGYHKNKSQSRNYAKPTLMMPPASQQMTLTLTCILRHSSLQHQKYYETNFVKIFAKCYDEEGLGKLITDEKIVSVQRSKTGEDSLARKTRDTIKEQ